MPKAPANISQGVDLPLFGRATGRHAMRNSDANLLVHTLNAFLNLEIKYTDDGPSRLLLVKGKSVLVMNRNEITEGTDPGTATSIKRAQITALAGDYLTCTLWDNTAATFTGASVNVAKPPKLRNSIASESLGGTNFSYSYSDTNTRVATGAGYDSETYTVDRPYSVGDELFVSDTGEATGVAATTYIDLNVDGRAWIAIPIIPIP